METVEALTAAEDTGTCLSLLGRDHGSAMATASKFIAEGDQFVTDTTLRVQTEVTNLRAGDLDLEAIRGDIQEGLERLCALTEALKGGGESDAGSAVPHADERSQPTPGAAYHRRRGGKLPDASGPAPVGGQLAGATGSVFGSLPGQGHGGEAPKEARLAPPYPTSTIRDRYQAAASSIEDLGDAKQLFGKELPSLTTNLEEALRDAWRAYTSQHTVVIDDAVLEVLATIPSFETTIATVRSRRGGPQASGLSAGRRHRHPSIP